MNDYSINYKINIDPYYPKITLFEKSAGILQQLKELNARYFFRPEQELKKNLNEIEPMELTRVLNSFFMEMIQENRIEDPVKFLDRLASIIPLKKLQEAIGEDMADPLKRAKELLDEAKIYLQMTQSNNSSTSIQAHFSSVLDGLISILESIINAFGIGDFFKPAESESQANSKSHKVMMQLHLFSMITTATLPILGVATAGLIIGETLLGIVVLGIIWPLIKPITSYLPANAVNWTNDVKMKDLTAPGRKESLDEIANILKINRHPILIGPSRVGKSLTAKAFAKALERGDYPELKGKVVFRINTADMIGQTFLEEPNSMLNKISAKMGRHRDDIILVLDEIHMACKNNEKIADQLKTFLDEGGEFPHVIGISTKEEYEKYIKDNSAFSLRFDPVNIENTNRDETLKILSDILLKSRSKPLITAEALDQIYDKSCEVEGAPQPTTSMKLLKRCINRTEKTQKSPTEKKILEVSNKILSLRSQAAASRSRKKDVAIEIIELEKQMNNLREELSKEQKELDKLYKTKDLLERVTKETYFSILKISAVAQVQLNSYNEKQIKLFLLLHEFLGPLLELLIKEKSNELDVKTIIDKTLIDEVANT